MKVTILLLAMILAWASFLTALYSRFFVFPKWFGDPPASFELLRKERANARRFWMLLSFLFLIFAILGLILNWQHEDARSHVIGSLVCFAIIHVSGAIYFVKEINAFSEIPPASSPSPGLIKRVKSWSRWSIARDVLYFIAAVFVSIAWNHV